MTAGVPREGEQLYSGRGRRTKGDYKIDPETGCWVWQRALNPKGYPITVTTPGGRKRPPWHLYWERATGKTVPAGWHVHHRCKNTRCVNPKHLEAIRDRDHYLHHKPLTLEQLAEVRELGQRPGVSARAVAKQYGVSDMTVYRIWRGDYWVPEGIGGERAEPGAWPCIECSGPVVGPRHKVYCSRRCRERAGAKRRRAGIRTPGGSGGISHAQAVELAKAHIVEQREELAA